jgi:hypothetical protein
MCAHAVSGEVLLFTAVISIALVLAALKIIAADLDYTRRCDVLFQQARALREKQVDRLRNLRPRR